MPRNTNRKLPNSSQAPISNLASRTPETIRKSLKNQHTNNSNSTSTSSNTYSNNFTSLYQNNLNSESAPEFQKPSGIQIDSDEENLSSNLIDFFFLKYKIYLL